MSTSDLSPHDRLFRTVFKLPEQARGLIKALVPAPIAARIDWSTLKLEPATFIDEVSTRHADLLFSVQMDADRPLFLFVLAEHQSSHEQLMGLRVAGYVVRALEYYVETYGKPQQLPAVLPLVISHCEQPWSAPLSLGDLYELDQPAHNALGPHLLNVRYIVDDLSAQTEEGIRKRALAAQATVALLALRAVRKTRIFANLLVQWGDLLRALSPIELGPVLVYYLSVGEDPPEALRDVLHSHVSPEAGDLAMTTAERLREEGRAEGRVEGRTEGMTQLLMSMLTLKQIEVSPEAQARIDIATPEQLEHWAQRLLTANTLADMFAED